MLLNVKTVKSDGEETVSLLVREQQGKCPVRGLGVYLGCNKCKNHILLQKDVVVRDY